MSVALVSQLLVLASSLSGTVVDPQDLPVPGARVELGCRAQHVAVETDQQGRFTIVMSRASGGCRLTVTHRGFAPFGQPVGAAIDVVRIDLRLADITQHVNVIPEATSSGSIGSVFLSDGDLRTFAGNTTDLIRYARSLAGGTMLPAQIYVDGMPATELPSLGMVASIAVNADPFSAERTDGDVTAIDIITRTPARMFRFYAGGDVLGVGGGDALDPGARPASEFRNVGVAGPVPRVPLTFVASMGLGSTSRPVPIHAAVPGADVGGESALAQSHTWSGSLGAHFAPDAPFKARFSYRQTRTGAVNLGVGGIVLPDAGSSTSLVTHQARATLTGVATRFLYDGSVLINRSQWDTRANTHGAGIIVAGEVMMGGDPIAAGSTRHVDWMSKHVLRGTSRRPWIAGVTMSATSDSDRQTPNPAGLFEFADLDAYRRGLAGADSATWLVTRGDGAVHSSNVRIAPFVEKPLLVAGHLEVVAGARADYQSGLGTLVSPRLSLATQGHGFNVRAGAGLFVKDLPNTIFVAALKNDGQHLRQFMSFDTSLAGAGAPGLELPVIIRSGLAPGLVRPREVMVRASVERPAGRFTPGIEYTWTRARHLLGAERRADGTGWLDLFESTRAADRQRLHLQLQYAWKGRYLSAQYDWIRARDNTDGPFSFAGQAGNLAAEWARSAGFAPHNVTLVGTCPLPASLSMNVSYTWRSTSPYNITTGLDTAHDGLSIDRGGRARNSGDAPGYRSLDLYGYRRVQLPNVLRRANARMHVSIGLQAQNVLDSRNYFSMGSVIGATNFGRPLAAFPGRSLRVSLNID